jgi:hypothetical protein
VGGVEFGLAGTGESLDALPDGLSTGLWGAAKRPVSLDLRRNGINKCHSFGLLLRCFAPFTFPFTRSSKSISTAPILRGYLTLSPSRAIFRVECAEFICIGRSNLALESF